MNTNIATGVICVVGAAIGRGIEYIVDRVKHDNKMDKYYAVEGSKVHPLHGTVTNYAKLLKMERPKLVAATENWSSGISKPPYNCIGLKKDATRDETLTQLYKIKLDYYNQKRKFDSQRVTAAWLAAIPTVYYTKNFWQALMVAFSVNTALLAHHKCREYNLDREVTYFVQHSNPQ